MGIDLAGNCVDVFQKMFGKKSEVIVKDVQSEEINAECLVLVKIPYIIRETNNLSDN